MQFAQVSLTTAKIQLFECFNLDFCRSYGQRNIQKLNPFEIYPLYGNIKLSVYYHLRWGMVCYLMIPL